MFIYIYIYIRRERERESIPSPSTRIVEGYYCYYHDWYYHWITYACDWYDPRPLLRSMKTDDEQ